MAEELKMDNIKISIVLPVYNTGEYLKTGLNSLINQTLNDIEIICVNDGSTDNSLDTLRYYQKLDQRIIVLSQKNSGAGVARNRGANASHGKYIIFLDPDDFFELNMLEKLYNKMEATNADICIFQGFYYNDKTKEVKSSPVELLRKEYIPKKEIFSYKDIPENIFTITTGGAWNKIFRNNFIKCNNIKFQALKNTNDFYFTFTAMVCAKAITILNEPLIYYRRNVDSSLQSTKQNYPVEFFKALDTLYDKLNELKIYEDVKKSFQTRALISANWNLKSIKNREAAELVYNKIKHEVIKKYNVLSGDINDYPPFAAHAFINFKLISELEFNEYHERTLKYKLVSKFHVIFNKLKHFYKLKLK